MATPSSMDPASWLRQQLEHADVDLLRQMVVDFANALMSADVDGLCGADYGAVSEERTNRRNGYRTRDWDTRAGTVELAIPKLRTGSYFPSWLLEPRRSEKALVQVIADCYLAGGVHEAGRQAGGPARDRPHVQVPGVGAGQELGRHRRGLLGSDYTTHQMSYDRRRLRLHGLIRRIPGRNRYVLTDGGLRFVVHYTKPGDRVVGPLFDTDRPNAPPKLQRALATPTDAGLTMAA